MGVRAETTDDSITVIPESPPRAARIRTYDDHRMAMSFALAGLRQPGVRINDPRCTSKTYPGYFNDLAAAVN